MLLLERHMARILELTLNGRRRVDAVPDSLLLLDYLREVVGLTGTKTGCDGGECGACTVLVDDQPRLSCLTLAGGVNGQRVDTVEALGTDGRLSAVQRGFHEKLGSQCGYCTPGFIMASAGLLRRNPRPSDDEIREALGTDGRLSAVQRGFHEKLGSQCGYCTPGFIMASAGLLRRNPRPSDDEIREALGSNICRCTGYVKIVEAVKYAAELNAAGVAP
jgi:4-hydroxybenzoyl-CoA reductase subunit gamma